MPVQETAFTDLHLMGFERRLSGKTLKVQRARLQKESPSTADTNDQEALARALIGCGAVWGLLAIPFVVVALALQVTIGTWCLLAWAGAVACVGMNRWRGHQAKGLLKQVGIETSPRHVIRQQLRQTRAR